MPATMVCVLGIWWCDAGRELVMNKERERWEKEKRELTEELKTSKKKFAEAKLKLQDQTELAIMLQVGRGESVHVYMRMQVGCVHAM